MYPLIPYILYNFPRNCKYNSHHYHLFHVAASKHHYTIIIFLHNRRFKMRQKVDTKSCGKLMEIIIMNKRYQATIVSNMTIFSFNFDILIKKFILNIIYSKFISNCIFFWKDVFTRFREPFITCSHIWHINIPKCVY